MSNNALRNDLRELRKRLDRTDRLIAEKVAEKERTEEIIAMKRAVRDKEPTDRDRELTAMIQKLIVERKDLKRRLDKARPRREKLQRWIKRTARKLRNSISPKVVDLGFDRGAVRGLERQGTVYGSVGHYTAGPLDDDGDDEAFELWRRYDAAHKAQGWSCLGYNIGVTRDGTVVRLRGVEYVGAHTLNYNTGRVGISVHGTTGDTWTTAQKRGLRKALKKWGLQNKPVIGHWEAPGQSTACPGAFLAGYHSKGR